MAAPGRECHKLSEKETRREHRGETEAGKGRQKRLETRVAVARGKSSDNKMKKIRDDKKATGGKRDRN